MDRGKAFRIIGGVLLGGGVAYIAINKFVVQPKKTKEIDQISEAITGAKATQGISNAFLPTYWRDLNKAGTIQMQSADAAKSKTDAQVLNDALGTFTWKDDVVIGKFKTFTSKAYVSMVSDSFQQAYNTDLRIALNHMSSDSLNQVLNLVTSLKDY